MPCWTGSVSRRPSQSELKGLPGDHERLSETSPTSKWLVHGHRSKGSKGSSFLQ